MKATEIIGESMAGIRESAEASRCLAGWGTVVRAEFGLGSLADRAVLSLHAGEGAHRDLDALVGMAWEIGRAHV